MNDDDIRAAGTAVRRRILGDAHDDRAIANTTDLTKEFQDLVTRYGWGEVWTRPGFDYRTRRILVLGTMLAIGRWEEFRLHLRAALADGFSLADVKELMLQQAIYCGIPMVNTGFHHVDAVVKELTSQGVKIDIG
jgi:alkylhydroperoxidase/carboxymuconolactone decarboxylase family protein YurZ